VTRRMEVHDYSPSWVACYEDAAAELRETLGDVLIEVHHIGSTSVPGLASKPVIDILLEVADLDALDALNSTMEALGYIPRGEFGIPGRRYFPRGGDARTHHVHAYQQGSQHVRDHLVFRDYLRAHPQEAEAYAVVKRAASKAHLTDPESYVEYKSAHVRALISRALDWAKQHNEEDAIKEAE